MEKTKEIRLERQRAAVIRFAYWTMLLGGGYLAIRYLLPVLLPFVLAYLIAWVLHRPITWASEKLRLPRGAAAALWVVFASMLAAGVLTLIGTPVFFGLRRGVSMVPELFRRGILPALNYFFDWLEQLVGSFDPAVGAALSDSINSALQLMSEWIVQLCGGALGSVGGALAKVPSVFMKTLITLIASVFIAADFNRIRSFCVKLIPQKAKAVLREGRTFFGRTVPRCLGSYFVIFVVTFAELFLGFLLLRISGAAAAALIVAFLDILPVLGTGMVLLPWAVISLLRGRIAPAIGLVVLYIVITVVRNTLEPRLVGRQIRLHPVITFAGMLVGLRFFGFFGMFGVPLALAFLRQLYEKGILKSHFSEEEIAAS